MKVSKRTVIYLAAWALTLLFHLPEAHAAPPFIYAAVIDSHSSPPGIVIARDLNDDNDASDPGEIVQYVSGYTFLDVAADENGILYAIELGKEEVYRIEDLNHDGVADGPGEVGIFRDSTGEGIALVRPMSITVARDFDPDTMAVRTLVTVMDLALQSAHRLQDLNGDNDAQDSGEIATILESIPEAPFEPTSMSTDELGSIVVCNRNTRSVVRLDDVNFDGFFEPPRVEYCPSAGCGGNWSDEYHKIRSYQFAHPYNLQRPFGVSASLNHAHNSLVYFVSDDYSAMTRVLKLTDLNGDDDALAPDEVTLWGYVSEGVRGYDIVCDEFDMCFVAYENWDGTGDTIKALFDNNNDGDAMDHGERWHFADFSSIGTPLGLAIKPPSYGPQTISPELVDSSPLKGPLLVVEDGETVTLIVNVTDLETGEPAGGVRVGHAVVSGCFELCPQSYRTASSGIMEYLVSRTAPSPEGGELLKFWVFGDEVTVPIVSTPCTPVPEAAAGPDQEVQISQVVVLDGSGSTGVGLHYCWEQIEGPDVGLPDCDFTTVLDPTRTFTAPSSSSTLLFSLTVNNACDLGGTDEVNIEVYSCWDIDGDGHDDMACGGDDCDDSVPVTFPGATELCDARDNDCDASIPYDEIDNDGDRYVECDPWVGILFTILGGNDCDDHDQWVNPGVTESTADGNCSDGKDNDCDGLVDGDDPGCRDFTLELDASYATILGKLNLDYTIGTSESATWANYLILTYPSIQVIPLWSFPLPVIDPPIDFPISFPFPQVGMIGIYTGLFTTTGPEDVELVWVDTGL